MVPGLNNAIGGVTEKQTQCAKKFAIACSCVFFLEAKAITFAT